MAEDADNKSAPRFPASTCDGLISRLATPEARLSRRRGILRMSSFFDKVFNGLLWVSSHEQIKQGNRSSADGFSLTLF